MHTPIFKEDFFYTQNNEWAKKLENNNILSGIDDYSQSALGDIVFIELPENNSEVQAGKPFGSLEATKSVCDLISPVSGKIMKVNENLKENPGIINFDPFGEGWLIEIEPSDLSELNNLMNVNEYKNYLKSKIFNN